MKVFTDLFKILTLKLSDFLLSCQDGLVYFPLKEQISTLKLHIFFSGPNKHILLSYPTTLRYHDLLEVI